MPLEEISAIFGDEDEIAIYQREIEIDHNTHTLIDRRHGGKLGEKFGSEAEGVENVNLDSTKAV
jgi:hypothetical protein